MDIVYCIDDHYVPQAAAPTASILEHAQPSGDQNCPGRFSYVFHILSNGVSEENRKRFSAFVHGLGAEAHFYDLGDFEGKLERVLGAKPETGRFAKAALGRIFYHASVRK